MASMTATEPVHTEEQSVSQPAKKKKTSNADEVTIIPKTIFRRCIGDFAQGVHFTEEAVKILQQETEAHAIRYLQDVAQVASNSNRETVMESDAKTVRAIYANHSIHI